MYYITENSMIECKACGKMLQKNSLNRHLGQKPECMTVYEQQNLLVQCKVCARKLLTQNFNHHLNVHASALRANKLSCKMHTCTAR